MGQYLSILLFSYSDLPDDLPDSKSPDLHLSHPTGNENKSIWRATSTAWKDALTVHEYLEESSYLMSVPLAKNQGMTQWVLVDKRLPSDQRQLLASCETFRKRSLVSDPQGNILESITHGIASVYCNPAYRGRGYASRMLRELNRVLPTWQAENTHGVVASVLYSDIGGGFYERLGWVPFPSHHIVFEPVPSKSRETTPIFDSDLPELCEIDERLVRTAAIAKPAQDQKALRFAILPDCDHMRWHYGKEEFVCNRLFGKKPDVKGAVAGQPGSRVWVIWTHRFYEHPDNASGNTLYILRLGIESQFGDTDRRDVDVEMENLKLVLQAAQTEASEWNLHQVQLWDPSPEVAEWIVKTGIPHRAEVRTQESLGCLQWYGNGGSKEGDVDWLYNEKYAWC